ncbi:MAG: hypothetical protein JNG86_22820 [Verrucomicrobiaceae bacterium]|nr:hypothetical protein [Verrucomicrobiaceae bacterium]
MTHRSLLASLGFGALLAGIAAPLTAQVNYDENGQPWKQRADSGPDAEVPGWYYNLGLTGLRAELVAAAPKALVVRHVFPGTPASGHIQVDDRIIGAGGQLFQNPHRNGYGMEVFGAHGPVAELAEALEACQAASGSGQLRLTVRNGKKVRQVELDIGKKYGGYAPTYPADCPKSEKILNELLDYLLSQQTAEGSFGNPVHNTFAPLALLASGDPRHLPAVERCARHLSQAIQVSDEDRKYGLMNWTYMGSAIVLSEYYLATKKRWILPELRKIHALLMAGQYLHMSQIDPKVKQTHPDDYPTGPEKAHGGWGHNPGFEGYGPIAMLTAQGALSYALMQRCGIDTPRERLDAAYAFLKKATGPNGYVWYSDSLGGGPDDWADMGRTGATALANFLCPYPKGGHRRQARLHATVIGQHPQSFPDTHGSPVMGMAYSALAAHIEPASFRQLMDANRWWFTMAQCTDGTFYYQPNRDNAGYGADARMSASSVVAFIYSIPRRSLVITGKAAPPVK